MTDQTLENLPLANVQIHFVNSFEQVENFMSWLGQRREALAFDTETGGLEYWREPLRLVQFGDTETGWAIPWHEWPGLVREVIKKYDGPLVGHNLPFDVEFTEHHYPDFQWPWGRSHDTRIQAHILNSNRSTALKPLGDMYVDKSTSWGQQQLHSAMKQQGWSWRTVPVGFQQYWFYGALDCVITARLDKLFRPQIMAQYRDVYEVEMAVAHVVSDMERRGCRIDMGYCEAQLEELGIFAATTRGWVEENYSINPGSNMQVAKALKEVGITLVKQTPTGQDALDVEVLSGIDHPLAQAVLNMRKAEKIANTYFQNFIEMQHLGFLHPQINTLGARTGRMSMTMPALQTLPRGSIVRNAFIAREGHSLVTCDYEQVEMRMLAHFSQDPGMIAAFHSDEDFFVELARAVYQDPTITKKDPRRAIIKGVGYGKAYGAGVPKMALTAGVPEEQMRVAHDQFNARFPGVTGFQKAVERVASERLAMEGEPYVVTPLGRRLASEPDKAYKLVNYLIQSHAGELLKLALIRLDKAGIGDWMVLPVHDEVIFDIPHEHVKDALPVIKDAMCDLSTYAVPITAEPDGPFERWGDQKK